MFLVNIKYLLQLLRPKHWIKNFFVFIPVFISGNFFDLNLLKLSFYGFILFCSASSFIYVLNDLVDIKRDKLHPIKKKRPLAANLVSARQAILMQAFLLALILFILKLIAFKGSIPLLIYFLINLLYSLHLKHYPVIDVLCISTGFVLRVTLGVIVTNLDISPWLIALTFSLCMLLALGKRRAELSESTNITQRPSLSKYNEESLKGLQSIFVGCTIIFYVLYTIFSTSHFQQSMLFFYSSVFVIAGLSRYMLVANSESMIEEPTSIVYQDKFILSCVILWTAYLFLIIY
jgi:decaprenyl-phosphate phosphoribosyltransferase